MRRASARTEPPTSTGPSTPHTLLVADADIDTRQLYRQSFELVGWAVEEASDGREALAKALADEPALVVTEARLPFLDGYALCDLLRHGPATCDVPLLFVTGEHRPEHFARATRAGADAVLTKPTLPEQLVEAANELVGRSRELHGRAASMTTTLAAQVDAPHRMALSKTHARFDTTIPPAPPPELTCPSYDHRLKYDHSHVGGVSARHSEQWDYFVCSMCGTFQYRQRTRTLRRVQ
jgi:CheY-like chemotaxis protein